MSSSHVPGNTPPSEEVEKEQPQFEHDCSGCQFLGRANNEGVEYDVYFHKQEDRLPRIVTRFGDKEQEYQSRLVSDHLRRFRVDGDYVLGSEGLSDEPSYEPDITQIGYEMARERGLIPEHDPQEFNGERPYFLEHEDDGTFLGQTSLPDGSPADLYFQVDPRHYEGIGTFDELPVIKVRINDDRGMIHEAAGRRFGGYWLNGIETIGSQADHTEDDPSGEKKALQEGLRRAQESGLIERLRTPTKEQLKAIDEFRERERQEFDRMTSVAIKALRRNQPPDLE